MWFQPELGITNVLRRVIHLTLMPRNLSLGQSLMYVWWAFFWSVVLTRHNRKLIDIGSPYSFVSQALQHNAAFLEEQDLRVHSSSKQIFNCEGQQWWFCNIKWWKTVDLTGLAGRKVSFDFDTVGFRRNAGSSLRCRHGGRRAQYTHFKFYNFIILWVTGVHNVSNEMLLEKCFASSMSLVIGNHWQLHIIAIKWRRYPYLYKNSHWF